MKKTGIYCLVSTLDQSTDNQRTELIRYSEARDWEVYKIYEENRSGASDQRPKFQELMKDARERRLDIVLCLKLDRMYRSTRGMLAVLEEFQSLGIEFCSLRDNIDLTTASGKLLASLLASVAEFERALILERVKSGIAHAKAKGVRFGRPMTRDDSKILALRNQGHPFGRFVGISMCPWVRSRGRYKPHRNPQKYPCSKVAESLVRLLETVPHRHLQV